jgi:hypothetical protein
MLYGSVLGEGLSTEAWSDRREGVHDESVPVAWEVRLPFRRTSLGVVVAQIVVAYWFSGSVAVVLLIAGVDGMMLMLARRVRLTVTDDSVVIQNLVRREYRWPEIDGFSQMPFLSGRPGATGAVVVGGKHHEVLALQGSDLDRMIGRLNDAVSWAKWGMKPSLAFRRPTEGPNEDNG